MKIKLYKPFEHWNNFDNIFVYSDTHFGDKEMAELRGNVVSDEEQIKRINQKVGKKGMIIFLGDIGDIKYIKKIKGYKVLIMGNHDQGKSNFERKFDMTREWFDEGNGCGYYIQVPIDNHLFDEVYDGPLMINDKIMLSHEPVDLPFIFNIHGHVHDKSKMKLKLNLLNVCAEHIDYTPVSLKNIAKSGLVGDVHNIHRTTIDNATDRKIKRNKEALGKKH